jgi:hypothetical protein
MLSALVLLCSIAVTPDLRDCARHNATAVLRVPGEFAHPAVCLMQAQAFLAETSIAHEIGDDDRVKVVCVRTSATTATKPPRSACRCRRKTGTPTMRVFLAGGAS